MKSCTNKNCTQNNPQKLTAFSINKKAKSGYHSRCKTCDSLYRKQNKEKRREYNKKYKKEHYDAMKSAADKWVKNNPEKVRAKDAKWRKNNPAKRSAKQMRRQANKLKATPLWLTEEHYKQILYFYELAKELQWLSEEQLQVDHIIPLQGKNVCGLHVPWNLQILPKSMNISKGNKLKE
jgi:hypothetical protein